MTTALSLGDVLAVAGAVGSLLLALCGFFWSLHRCIEKRVTRVELRLGGSDDDTPLSQQVAVLGGRFQAVEEQVGDLHDFWRREMERRMERRPL